MASDSVTDWWIARLLVGVLALWVLGASIATKQPPFGGKWLDEPGNGLRLTLWLVLGIPAWLTWLVPEQYPLGKWRQELTLLALTIVGIEEVQNRRAWLTRKREFIEQMASRSNDFALDAARIVVKNGWHRDGSLVGAELGQANLQGVRLTDAILQGATLAYADLRHAHLDNADMQRTFLVGANLERALLAGAILQAANLGSANLRGAILVGANLQLALLSGANLQGANLVGANLQGASLIAVDLRKATYTSSERWGTQRTSWPDGFDCVAAGAIEFDPFEDTP